MTKKDTQEKSSVEEKAQGESPVKKKTPKEIKKEPKEETEKNLRKEIERLLVEQHWYALMVQAQHERKLVDAIEESEDRNFRNWDARRRAGNTGPKDDFVRIETYLPIRKVKKKYSDRMKIVDEIITPGIIFVRLRMADKERVYADSRYIKMFYYDRIKRMPSVITDDAMRIFREAIGETDIEMVTPKVGDQVTIMSGPWQGQEGTLIREDGKNRFQVRFAGQYFAFSIDKDIVFKLTKDLHVVEVHEDEAPVIKPQTTKKFKHTSTEEDMIKENREANKKLKAELKKNKTE